MRGNNLSQFFHVIPESSPILLGQEFEIIFKRLILDHIFDPLDLKMTVNQGKTDLHKGHKQRMQNYN